VYDVPVSSILALNGLTTDSVIYPGAVLRVASRHVASVEGARAKGEKKKKPSYAPTATGAPVPTAVGTIKSLVVKVVRFMPNAPDHLIRGAVAAVRSVAVGLCRLNQVDP
jgi:hypothetical protein